MWCVNQYETSHRCSNANHRGAAGTGKRACTPKTSSHAPVPDSVSQFPRGAGSPHAEQLGCDEQTVLYGLHAFNAAGLMCLQKKSEVAPLWWLLREVREWGAAHLMGADH